MNDSYLAFYVVALPFGTCFGLIIIFTDKIKVVVFCVHHEFETKKLIG